MPVLADSKPLVTLPLLGESFISYWLHKLATEGVKEARLITSDDPECFQDLEEQGSRWGLKVELFREMRDLSIEEARKRYRPAYENDWRQEDVIIADHVPGLPDHKVFASYENWFRTLALWLPFVAQSKRIGLKEIQPGIWAQSRARVSKSAKLVAPCWLGDNVRIGKGAVVGPFAFLEDQVVVDESVEIENSWVGPDTFLGALTRVHESLAWGNLLISWRTGSHILVPDAFLMSSLRKDVKPRKRLVVKDVAPETRSPLARPFEAVISLAQKFQS